MSPILDSASRSVVILNANALGVRLVNKKSMHNPNIYHPRIAKTMVIIFALISEFCLHPSNKRFSLFSAIFL